MTSSQIELFGMGPALVGSRWESEQALRIGRMQNLDIVLDDASVSRRHAEVTPQDSSWVVRDLGSRNGTYVNDCRVGTSGQSLRNGNIVRIGEVALRVKLAPEPAPRIEPAPEQSRIKTSGAYMRLKAVSHNSWEDAVQTLDSIRSPSISQDQRFQALVRAGYHVSQSSSLDEMLSSILEDIVGVFQAQHGAITLLDQETGELTLRAAVQGRRANRGAKPFSRTLVERCFSMGQSILCQDVSTDEACQTTQSVSVNGMASVICVLLRSPRRRLGVLHLDRGPLQAHFNSDDFYLADALAACVSTGIESALLIENQREQVLHTVTALAQAVELRDQYTGNHTQRVTTYSLMLADALQLSPAEHHLLQIGTPLHDVGKIGIDDDILRKPGRLTPAEYEKMKSHTVKGAAIVEAIPSLASLIPIVRNHHERWDGRGYPDGLGSEKISRLARVVAVADAFDAMTSDRSYRLALPVDRAYDELTAKAGTHFDPNCVAGFQQLRPQVERILARDRQDKKGVPSLDGTMSAKALRQARLEAAGSVTAC